MVIIPTLTDVTEAHDRIAEHIVRTPVMEFAQLNILARRRVLVKIETLQHTGAFKFRGAMAKLTNLSEGERTSGVVAYSTGNHGMAIAEAARLLGISATIVVPLDAPNVKVERMVESGAAILRCDRFTENGEQIGRDLAMKRGAVFVHPFDDATVIGGQGTLALEMADQAAEIEAPMDVLLVSSAGGGFVSGCALAMQEVSPRTQVWSVECSAWNAIARSLQSGRHEDNLSAETSICDAIQARAPGKSGYEIFSQIVERGIDVSDEQALHALRYAFERLRLVVEPGGVVGLAAILADMVPDEFQTVGIVLCGANVDPSKFREWLGR